MKSKLALITGASSGLGSDFARELAARNHDLFITARRLDRLESLKKEIESKHDVEVHVFSADLSDPGGVGSILDDLKNRKKEVDVLINNAGYGTRTFVLDKQPEEWERMIRVNVNSLTALTMGILPSMVKKQGGKILNVASTGAFQAVPWFTVYAAAKSFVLSFSEGLAKELKDKKTNVRVACLCPGPTRTEFISVSGADTIYAPEFLWMESKEVVDIGLKALERNETVCIPGIINKLQFYCGKFVPRVIITRAAGFLYKPEDT